MSHVTIDDRIREYEIFINDVLKEDLRKVDLTLQQVNSELSDLIQQKHTMKVVCDKKSHPNGFKTQINIGCDFFMEASVPDTSLLLFNIGLNHYLELTTEEANKYLDQRIKVFEQNSENLRDQAAQIKAHIKLMLFHLGELQSSEKR